MTPEAKADLRGIYRYIRKRAPRAAGQWSVRARPSIKTLSKFPERCPLAPESAYFDETIRQMFIGSGNRGTYRVLFVIVDKSVRVIHVRHGSMLPFGVEEEED
ncbi:MAG: type II toxin-antitoxin system RelE/ParE family toxin [Candidatus Sulfotelmatobacter sp.]